MQIKNKDKKVISQDNLEIYYWITKKNKMNNDFVLLHPASSMNHSSLLNLEKSINDSGRPTILFDPRGVGYSHAPAKKETYTLDNYSDDIKKIFETEGILEPTLIGHSAGFMPIIDYVSKYQNANSVVGICGSYNFPSTTKNKLFFHVFNRGIRYFEYPTKYFLDLMHKTTEISQEYSNQSNLTTASGWETYLSIIDVPISEIRNHIISGIEINNWDIRNQLKQVNNKLILLYGEKDSAVIPRTGELIKSTVPGECFVEIIKNGGHMLPMKNSDQILEILKKYSY